MPVDLMNEIMSRNSFSLAQHLFWEQFGTDHFGKEPQHKDNQAIVSGGDSELESLELGCAVGLSQSSGRELGM